MGSDRPRMVSIGASTLVTINYRNFKTKVPFLGVTGGTLKLFDDVDEAQTLLTTVNFVEDTSVPGDYFATIPFNLVGLVEGSTGRFLIEIAAAKGFEVNLQGRCVFRSPTDTGL